MKEEDLEVTFRFGSSGEEFTTKLRKMDGSVPLSENEVVLQNYEVKNGELVPCYWTFPDLFRC